MDVFEKFETDVIGWFSRHILFVISIGTFLILITVICMALAMIAGTVGMGVVYSMQYNSHAGNQSYCLQSGHVVTDEEMKNWDTLIMPVAGFMFQWLYWFTIILIVGYISIAIYFMARAVYRWRNRT